MNTTTIPSIAEATKGLVKKPAKAKAKPAAAPGVATSAKDDLHAKVIAAIANAKGQPLNLSVPLLEKALAEVHAAAPSPDFALLGLEGDKNKATRITMLKETRELRASLGFQVAARMLNDAIASTHGVSTQHSYGVRQLTTGGLVSTETVRSKLLTTKKVRGISIR